MIETLWTMQLHAAVIVIGSAITLAFGVMVGHRIDFWIDVLAPEVGERLPTDAGAWAGLGVAVFVLLA